MKRFYCKNRLSIGLGTALYLVSLVASGGELRDIEIEREDDRYHLTSESYLDVAPESLYRVLSNFELFEKFSSAIVESKNTGPDDMGRPGFYTRMEGCVLLFCQSFIRVGHLLLSPDAEIVAIANPEESDFYFSRERWTLIPEGDGTVMVYDFELEPAFWVPPVIGPIYIKHALRGGAERAVGRIEALAFSEQLRNEARKK